MRNSEYEVKKSAQMFTFYILYINMEYLSLLYNIKCFEGKDKQKKNKVR